MEPQLTIFDALESTAQQRKDAGISLVINNAGQSFVDQACDHVKARYGGQEVLAEAWRESCLAEGIKPHHSNAWGALTNELRRRGLIRFTGQYRESNSKRNHKHPYKLWEVVL